MKRLADRIWFFLSVGVLNLAIGIMFYTVTIKPLVARAVPSGLASIQDSDRGAYTVPATVGTPVRLVIPSLAMDLPVAVGSYNPDNGSWTLDATKAYYADVSLPVNDSNGRTVIYGHAQAQVFAALANLPAQAEAEVYTDNGYIFHYVYASVKEVVPTDTSVFQADGPPTVVLQTCSGPWDAYRALHFFSLESVRKI